MDRQNPSRLPRRVLIAAGVEALYWLYLVIGGINDALPFARGYGEVAAVLGTLVFVPFVLPALALALAGRALSLAAALAGFAGFLYLLDPLYRLDSALDAVPAAGVFAIGLAVALGGVALALARRRKRAA